MPRNKIHETFKKNASFDFVVICTILNHTFVGIKFWIFNKKGKQKVGTTQDNTIKAFVIQRMNTETLYK